MENKKLFTKNFTLLIAGQSFSLFGNLLLRFALSMYVLEITGSASIFAGILAAAVIPTILISPFGGILADRANKKWIMVILDAFSGLLVLMAVLLFSFGNEITIITVLLIMLSVLGAFESPTVQACVPQMLEGDKIIKGNAVVNQVAAIASLIAPVLGGGVYAAFGLRMIMFASVACFFVTAAFECFIRLDFIPMDQKEGFFAIIKDDFQTSMRFICEEQPGILKMLFLAAVVNFFVVGIALVGLPYIVRTIFELNAQYYGIAESVLGVAAIIGSIAAGLLTGKLKLSKLSTVLAILGAFIIPAGLVFCIQTIVSVKYIVILLSFCGVQIAACIFSIFALSYIQQETPNALIGKVMAYITTISLCAQPLGQTIYGLLFDLLKNSVYLILIPTGVIVCAIGLLSTNFFKKIQK